LHGDNEAEVAAAKAEAAERSISERQLKLARGAVDPDPAVRKEVVEALAVIDEIDTREWLLWLSHDRDPLVRSTSLSLMATSNDLRFKKRVLEAASNDADWQIREQARAALTGRTRLNAGGGQ
jgi:hypothetical protein